MEKKLWTIPPVRVEEAMFAVFYLIDAAIDALAMWIVSDVSCNYDCNHDCNQGRRCRCGGGL